MTKEMVVATWSKPYHKSETKKADKNLLLFIFSHHYSSKSKKVPIFTAGILLFTIKYKDYGKQKRT